MCNEEIIKHMEEDMTFRGLSERTQKSYIWRVSRYMKFYEGKDIEKYEEKKAKEHLTVSAPIHRLHHQNVPFHALP